MTEIDLVAFLKEHLHLEIKESHSASNAINCKKIEIMLVLKTAEKSHVLSTDSFKIHEDLR